MINDFIKILRLENEEVVTYNKVRDAYRALAKQVHPDKHTIPSLKLASMKEFIIIKNAHDELLSHIEKFGSIYFSSIKQEWQQQDKGSETETKNESIKNRKRTATYIDDETVLDKIFMGMPLIIIFGPSLFVTYFTVAVLGVLFFGLPGSLIHLVGKAKFGEMWPQIAEKYFITPLLILSPIIIYAMPLLVSAKKSGINWTQVYIWWGLITPAAIYVICKQLESLILIIRAKKTLSLVK